MAENEKPKCTSPPPHTHTHTLFLLFFLSFQFSIFLFFLASVSQFHTYRQYGKGDTDIQPITTAVTLSYERRISKRLFNRFRVVLCYSLCGVCSGCRGGEGSASCCTRNSRVSHTPDHVLQNSHVDHEKADHVMEEPATRIIVYDDYVIRQKEFL